MSDQDAVPTESARRCFGALAARVEPALADVPAEDMSFSVAFDPREVLGEAGR